jgi:NAD(P)-dependent dehydrogenase (short-subunit alcohol dehydrogenase family)
MSQEKNAPTILIAGASRGIGLGLVREYLARGWHVIATVRKASAALAAATTQFNEQLRIEQLDINSPEQIGMLASRLCTVSLDVLFVNAGVSDDPRQTIGEISAEEFIHVMVTNALSPLRVIEKLAPRVKPHGTIAAMSSLLGSVSLNTDGGYETYRASKAALNMLLRSYVARAGGERSFLALMPGWVRTDMGGPDAPIEIEDSVRGLANTIGQHGGRVGLTFIDYQGQLIPW